MHEASIKQLGSARKEDLVDFLAHYFPPSPQNDYLWQEIKKPLRLQALALSLDLWLSDNDYKLDLTIMQRLFSLCVELDATLAGWRSVASWQEDRSLCRQRC